MADRFIRNPKVEMAPMKGETVLFNPGNNKFCVLNATAAFIWQSLEHPQSAQEIANALVQQYANVEPVQAQRDVQATIEELHGIECVVLH